MIFANGRKRVRRLMLMELASACIIIGLVQLLATIPAQDWIPEVIRKELAFAIGTAVTLLKAGEMFFNRSAALYRESDTEFVEKPK